MRKTNPFKRKKIIKGKRKRSSLLKLNGKKILGRRELQRKKGSKVARAGVKKRNRKKGQKKRLYKRKITTIHQPVNVEAGSLESQLPPSDQQAPTTGSGTFTPGVNLVGLMYYEMGIGESCRLAARALSTTDVPFGMMHFPLSSVVRGTDLSWAHKEIGEPLHNTNIIHLNADTLLNAHSYYGDRLFKDRYTIGYWHWELPDFPDEFTSGFDLVNEVWVPTSFVQDSVARKAKVPVVRIPHGVEVSYSPEINRDTFGLPHDRFLFLSMFDTLSYMRRKNPQGAIEAFKLAFDRYDPQVGLVVKLNNGGARPGDLEYVQQLADGYPNIYILDQILSRMEVNSLIQSTDCYISLHRSEGFGLGLAEAMYLGKPVIGTNWSGNVDFMTPMNSCLVNYTLSKVGEDWGPYKGYQTWAEPDLAHAAAHMVQLVQHPNWRSELAAKGQETIRSLFSPAAVGAMMKQRLQLLRSID